MKLFGRKQSGVEQVPAEVQEYYKSERRERLGVAWLLSLGTLLFTLVLAGVLFLGGEWTYHHLIHKTKNASSSQTATSNGNNTGTSSTSTNTPSNTNSGSSSSGSTAGGSGSSPAPAPSTPSPSPTPTPASTPTPAGSTLINTGPGDE